MTIEEMKKDAMLKMNREIERLQDNNDATTWRDVSNVLSAYLYVGLVSGDEYWEYCERIYNIRNNWNEKKGLPKSSP